LEAKGSIPNVEHLLRTVDDSPNGKLTLKRATPAWRRGEAVPNEIVELTNYYDQSLLSALRLYLRPGDAIVQQAARARQSDCRGRGVGETLSFGPFLKFNPLRIQLMADPRCCLWCHRTMLGRHRGVV
jgi:hypothetical protein